MYLKNLTVLGFKSFADKTSLNFQPGVTAIVGPNGCGKSNVSDAIRWVLGEQSAKALRGGEMADVIFNGTDGRKPLGMAEVSLTIGGVDQEHLTASGVEVAYNEVTVTRRVFRDGGSEYFINKTPCRLKDIQQLFMGTGVGRTSYSIMAQGNITQILSSKPEDRRMVFEEAAGITKFKAQKKEALRKLEYTEQNLLRVDDLVREIKRQIGSLQRQAGKARRYRQLSQELQHLDTQLARHNFDILQGEIRERQNDLERFRAEIETGSANVLRHEEELTRLREAFSGLEHEISQMQQRGLELKNHSDRHESRIQFNEERLRELETQNHKALEEIAQTEERRQIAEQELGAVCASLEQALSEMERHRGELQRRQEEFRQIENQIREKQDSLKQAHAAAFGAAQELSRARNEITALDLQKQGNSVRLEKLSAEKIQLEEERMRLGGRLEEFAANVAAEKLHAQTRQGGVEERQRRLKELQEELNRATQEQDALLRTQAEKRSRLNVLEQLQAEHEGYSAGTLAALRQSQEVLGSLADHIRVPDQFVSAVESALGHHLQLVLTEQPETARQILTELQSRKHGRASIAPLALMRGADGHREPGAEAPAPAAPAELNGVPLPAVTVVQTGEAYRPLVERLLGMTRIVPDLDAATAAWIDSNGAYHYVTLSGDILSRHGIYTGGAANGNAGGNGKAPASILGRKNQIAELETALQGLAAQIAEVSRRKGGLQSEQSEITAGLQQDQTELRAQEVAIATHEGEFNALQTTHRLLDQKIETVVYEVQSLAAQEQEGMQKRTALADRARVLEQTEADRQREVVELNQQVDSLRQDREQFNQDLTESRVALATAEQMCGSHAQQRRSLEQRVDELGRGAQQRRSELGSFGQRRDQATAEIQASRTEIERLQHDREVLNAQTAELVGRRAEEQANLSAREEQLREQRRTLAEHQQQRGSVEVELAQKDMGVQNLRERIQQKYQVLLDDVRSECITITMAEEGPAKVHVMSPEEMAAAGAATDWGAVAEQVQTLQRRLDEMGPVNLVAIEEYEETEQRYQFLSKQQEDLVQAKAQLLEVINRINGQTRDMFRQTFEQIRENFRVMFTEVFGGGKADLILSDENDVLESGIEIVARPPGKQLQTISLLSGGEQTMTAVSLLFSIYQVKPSPFCVLDELDAPLDESNINRFIKVLLRFLDHSQFIIITHNKRTIGMADVLYGVTMQEHGVSKIVSVKFHKADDQNGGEQRARAGTTLSERVENPPAAPKAEEPEIMMAK